MRQFSALSLFLAFFAGFSVVSADPCNVYNCVETGKSCLNNYTGNVDVYNGCRYGSYCNSETDLCTKYAELNEACSGPNDLKCRSDLYCSSKTSALGSCLALPKASLYLYAGESCKENSQCQYTNILDVKESVCVDGKCKFTPEGQLCLTSEYDMYQCEYGVAYCNYNTKFCTAYTKDGEQCDTDKDDDENGCAPRSSCVPIAATGTMGECTKMFTGKESTFCEYDDQCLPGLYCADGVTSSSNGVCTKPNAKSVTIGLPCYSDSNCTRSNAESCACGGSKKSLELKEQTCVVRLYPKNYEYSSEDFDECVRINGCYDDSLNAVCAMKHCKSKYCSYWRNKKAYDYSENFDCYSVDICGAAAMYISPFLALFVLAALIFA